MKNKLSSIENTIHFSVWTVACIYGLYKLFTAQTDILESHSNIFYSLRDLRAGWWFSRNLKDVSDVEWSTWLYLIQLSWLYMIFQFMISEIIRRTNIRLLKYWYIVSTVVFLLNYMGWKQFLLIVSEPVIFWIILCLGGGKITVWVSSFVLLAVYNSLKYRYYFWALLENENDEAIFSLVYGTAWVQLRCISYCLDYLDNKKKLQESSDKDYSISPVHERIVNMFSYVMYLPVLFPGPIILYEEFEKSFHVKPTDLSLRLKSFIWNVTIYGIYTILLDLAFHYIYFHAMLNNVEAIGMLPSTALCAGGLWMGLEFQLKYVISYGTTTAFARLDNINTPPTPRCIARIHLYSQMWRYFDVGLYRFLYLYIYTPSYNKLKEYSVLSKNKLILKLISSLTTFIFIFMWHGTTYNILVWCGINYMGVILECCSKAIGKTRQYTWFKDNVLRTDAMEVRFIAFLCAPMLGLSAISSFHLMGGGEVGHLYFGLLKSPSLLNCLILYFTLYTTSHVAIALEDVPSRTDSKKIQKTV